MDSDAAFATSFDPFFEFQQKWFCRPFKSTRQSITESKFERATKELRKFPF
jgi:hypothetical protein